MSAHEAAPVSPGAKQEPKLVEASTEGEPSQGLTLNEHLLAGALMMADLADPEAARRYPLPNVCASLAELRRLRHEDLQTMSSVALMRECAQLLARLAVDPRPETWLSERAERVMAEYMRRGGRPGRP